MKKFETLSEIITDPLFVSTLEDEINAFRMKRISRPKPKPGYHYTRDWYDRMNDEGQFTTQFFLDEIGKIWNKQSRLPSEPRRIIQLMCERVLAKTVMTYKDDNTTT